MKISVENNIRHYDNMSYKSRIRSRAREASSVRSNRDQVFIGSSTLKDPDKKIAEEAIRKAVLDVRTPTSQEKIESLKQQVADGTYRPDAELIVSCMLLGKGND